MRLRICAWIDTSKAEIGSSATMKRGFKARGPGYADSLPLAAGKLPGVTVQVGSRDPAEFEVFAGRFLGCPSLGDAVLHDSLGHDASDVHPRIQARVRVLEDDLHVPPEREEFLRRKVLRLRAVEDGLPVEPDVSRSRLHQTKHAAAGRGFPRSPTRPRGRSTRPNGRRSSRRPPP